ncbi:MAG: glycine--tRNA ligase subunit alpha [Alphaproteobacteria bacterium]|nr:glycine--tRNA ligase subunit alpha [Alphaproteobacteria bacterium]
MPSSSHPLTLQEMIRCLDEFWASMGCVILPPLDFTVGAGTFHWATALRSLGTKPWRTAYLQPSRRPADGRYGNNPNRLGHFFQYQVLLKPSPAESQELYLRSLAALGLPAESHDIRFVEDDWESSTLGAWGLGWEVWCDGMEISQFTYFQQVGGIDCKPVSTELTYGLERLAMYIQGVENVYDLRYNTEVSYRDIFYRAEREYSGYYFDRANTEILARRFGEAEGECLRLLEHSLTLPAYDHCLEASHLFNILDARRVISATDRPDYIARVRLLAKACAEQWVMIEESEEYSNG